MSAAYCRFAPGDPTHGRYHDTEYGFPTVEESVLFERLILEINQAGLSWATILKKRAAFRAAYADFAVDQVAAFGTVQIEQLLADPGIIRTRAVFRRCGNRTGRSPFGSQRTIHARRRSGRSSSAGRFALPAARSSVNF